MTTFGNYSEACEIFEIRIQGNLPSRWFDWFDGFTVANLENGEALLTGLVRDQSELFGVLDRIHSLNLKLISINRAVQPPNQP